MSLKPEFRSILAWQRAMELAEMVWRVTAPPVTRQTRAESARCDLRRRIRRAAIAVPVLIATAEGEDDPARQRRDLARGRRCLASLATAIELAMRLELMARDPRMVELMREADRLIRDLRAR